MRIWYDSEWRDININANGRCWNDCPLLATTIFKATTGSHFYAYCAQHSTLHGTCCEPFQAI